MNIENIIISTTKKNPRIIVKVEDKATKTYEKLIELLVDFYDEKDLYLVPEEFVGEKTTTSKIYKEIKIKTIYIKDENNLVEGMRLEESGGKLYGEVNIKHIIKKTPISPDADPGCHANFGTYIKEFFELDFKQIKVGPNIARKKERNEFMQYILKQSKLN